MHFPVVLGIDFGGTKIAGAVCDIDGVRLGSMTIPAHAEDGARATLERGLAAARDLLDESAPRHPLVAVGACTFGIPHDEGVLLAPTIPGWGDLAFGRELRRFFAGAHVRTATDVKAAAQAEAEWGALVGCDPGIYLNLGTGLAAAIVTDGTVLAGRHGASGEIGYNLRQVSDVGLGMRVPLEDRVSGKALARAAFEMLPQGDGVAAVFANTENDPHVAALLADFIAELSFHLVNLAIAVDPERIVVGGGMMRAWSLLHDDLRAALDIGVPFPPELMPATFPFDAPLMGALALATAAARAITGASLPGLSPTGFVPISPVSTYSTLDTRHRKGASG